MFTGLNCQTRLCRYRKHSDARRTRVQWGLGKSNEGYRRASSKAKVPSEQIGAVPAGAKWPPNGVRLQRNGGDGVSS